MSSYFGNQGRSAGANGAPDQARLAEAAMELEAVSDLFNRIVSSCHAKCISTRYAEPELNKGEGVCVDRLVFSLPPPLWSGVSGGLIGCVGQMRCQVLCGQREGAGPTTKRPEGGRRNRRDVKTLPVLHVGLGGGVGEEVLRGETGVGGEEVGRRRGRR